MEFDRNNEMFDFAVELVNHGARNVFLTGKAGTGKTTFLKYIREHSVKQMAVVAPTGVAAINAAGATIHSFFQLPMAAFIPDSSRDSKENGDFVTPHSLISRLRYTREKTILLQELELLIIDEISMVRADTLDAIDTILRHARMRPSDAFGGVQVLLIGDMFQLPPVTRDDTWALLSPYYSSPFFFDSHVIRSQFPVYVELNKIYRQSEERFIGLLNQVRDNRLEYEEKNILEERYLPGFRPGKNDGYIILTTHNDRVREINSRELTDLPGSVYSYRAEVKGDFPDNSFPAEETLQLKIGAQVMFIKNDAERRYFNGKIGTLIRVEGEKLVVQCKDEENEIEVKKESWENIRYHFDQETRKIADNVLGSFSQYPLRLAWAITIHKSQGLTFQKAIIDAGNAFAPGQVYVALSRCTSLEGMVLHSRINTNQLFTDPRIVKFSRNRPSAALLRDELDHARLIYLQDILLNSFDFRHAITAADDIMLHLVEHARSFNAETIPWLEQLLNGLHKMQDVAVRFQLWIRDLFSNAHPGWRETIFARVARAQVHYSETISTLLAEMQRSPASTDSRLHAKTYNDLVRELFSELAQKKHIFDTMPATWDAPLYHARKNSFSLPPFSVNAYAGGSERITDTPNPRLYQELRKLRDTICNRKDLPIYMVASSRSLEEMAEFLPQSGLELEKIKGFGKAKAKSYGPEFLELIRQYSAENNLSSRVGEIKRVKKPAASSADSAVSDKPESRFESLRLFRTGLDIAAIAAQRKLTISTVETHLLFYVKRGEIDVERLVDIDTRREILQAIDDGVQSSAAAIKERVSASITYAAIRFVLAGAGQ